MSRLQAKPNVETTNDATGDAGADSFLPQGHFSAYPALVPFLSDVLNVCAGGDREAWSC